MHARPTFYVIPSRYVVGMELIMNTSNPESLKPEIADIEELLSAAGIEHEVVERCPYLKCDVCADDQLFAAA